MQKFGLQRNSSSRYHAVELEIIKEQASVLGRSGRKLRLSLESYQLMNCQNQGLNDNTASSNLEHDAILQISNNVWELILQREFLGFTERNVQWVRSNYVIPESAFKRLGLSDE